MYRVERQGPCLALVGDWYSHIPVESLLDDLEHFSLHQALVG